MATTGYAVVGSVVGAGLVAGDTLLYFYYVAGNTVTAKIRSIFLNLTGGSFHDYRLIRLSAESGVPGGTVPTIEKLSGRAADPSALYVARVDPTNLPTHDANIPGLFAMNTSVAFPGSPTWLEFPPPLDLIMRSNVSPRGIEVQSDVAQVSGDTSRVSVLWTETT